MPNRRDPFSTLPVGYGAPARYEISADQLVDGRFTVIASANDGSGCTRRITADYPPSCNPGGGGDGCPFVSEPVIRQGFVQSVGPDGGGYVVTTRTFDADFRPELDFTYRFDEAGVLTSSASAAPSQPRRLNLEVVDEGTPAAEVTVRETAPSTRLVGRYDDPRPVNVSRGVFERAFALSDGRVFVALGYARPGVTSPTPPRADYGFAGLLIDADGGLLGAADFGFGISPGSEEFEVYELEGGRVALVSGGLEGISAVVVAPDGSLAARFNFADRSGRPFFTGSVIATDGGGYAVLYNFEGRNQPEVRTFSADGTPVGGFSLPERLLDGSEAYSSTLLTREGGLAAVTRTRTSAGANLYTVLVYAPDGVLKGAYEYPDLGALQLYAQDDAGNLLLYAGVEDGFSITTPGRLVRLTSAGSLTCPDDTQRSAGVDLAVFLPDPSVDPQTRTLYNLLVEVRNQGDADATGVTLAGRYLNPEQELDRSGDGTFSRGPVTVPAGESRFYTVSLIANGNETPGLYAQVAAQDQPDADSTPGNGTPPTVNEDDEAVSGGGAPPTGSPIDLELSVSSASPAPARFTNNVVTYTIRNTGPEAATGVVVNVPTPAGVVPTGGSESVASQGTFAVYGDQDWTVGTLASGAQATLAVSYFRLGGAGGYVAYGQVSEANEADADSTPGNGDGATAREDDEASIDLTGGASTAALRISPNPLPHGRTLRIDLGTEIRTGFDAGLVVSDLAGRVIVRREVTFAAGSDVLPVDLSGLAPGVYVVAVPGVAVTAQRLVVQ